MRLAFHPEARLQSVQACAMEWTKLETYLTWLSGTPAEDEKDRTREVTWLHVADTIAVAEVILDYPQVRFVDYLTIVLDGSEWRIANKAFKAYPKDAT